MFGSIVKAVTGSALGKAAGAVFGSPVAGALVSGGLGYLGTRQQNAAASAQSQRQMDFQERMSNTSYQRAMEDMRKAGLNPILAYKQGGASTPAGAQAPMQNELTSMANSAGSLSQKISVRKSEAVQRDLMNTTRYLQNMQARHASAGAERS